MRKSNKIILVEFPWQTKEIINNKESFKKDVVVSLDPELSYVLKSNNIPYLETHDFCKHEDLWAKHDETIERMFKITKSILFSLQA